MWSYTLDEKKNMLQFFCVEQSFIIFNKTCKK